MESRGNIEGWGLRLTAEVYGLKGTRQRDTRDPYPCAQSGCALYCGTKPSRTDGVTMARLHAPPDYRYIWFPPAGSGLIFLAEEKNHHITTVWYLLEHPHTGVLFLNRREEEHQHVVLGVTPMKGVPKSILQMAKAVYPL